MQRDIVGGMCTNKPLSHFSQKREGMSEEAQVKDSNDNRTVIPKSSIYKCNGKFPNSQTGHANECPSPTRKFLTWIKINRRCFQTPTLMANYNSGHITHFCLSISLSTQPSIPRSNVSQCSNLLLKATLRMGEMPGIMHQSSPSLAQDPCPIGLHRLITSKSGCWKSHSTPKVETQTINWWLPHKSKPIWNIMSLQ